MCVSERERVCVCQFSKEKFRFPSSLFVMFSSFVSVSRSVRHDDVIDDSVCVCDVVLAEFRWKCAVIQDFKTLYCVSVYERVRV